MKSILKALAVALLFAGLSFAQIPEAEKPYVNSTLLPATGLLYSQSEDGEMKMRCTTTVIDQDATSYTVATAAHCGCEDDSSKHIVTPQKTFFFVSRTTGQQDLPQGKGSRLRVPYQGGRLLPAHHRQDHHLPRGAPRARPQAHGQLRQRRWSARTRHKKWSPIKIDNDSLYPIYVYATP